MANSDPQSSASAEQQSEHPLGRVSLARADIEAILLVVDAPVTLPQLVEATGLEATEVSAILTEIQSEFRARHSGMDLREEEGGWRWYTVAACAPVVEKFVLQGTMTKLTRAALETLAVIAYRQPVTRAQIAAIRGVNVDGVVRTLLLRGLIREVDVLAESGAHQYETTSLFLEHMGIEDLSVLPDLAPLLPDVDSIDEEF